MPRLTVIGSVNLDLVTRVEHLPLAGETVSGGKLERYPGGKGANQALAASRLGADVTFIARVGSDLFAAEALLLLKEAGVALDRVSHDPSLPTGIALIAVSAKGENQIVVAPGANHALAPDHLDFDPAHPVLAQLEIPRETVAALAARAKGFLAINTAPARPVDAAVLARADLLIANESEARVYGATLHAGDGLVALTRSAEGAELLRNGQRIASATPPTVTPVDTTGAGDAFSAALTLALVEGQPPERALRFACAAGAAATLRPGAQPSLPTRAEVEALL